MTNPDPRGQQEHAIAMLRAFARCFSELQGDPTYSERTVVHQDGHRVEVTFSVDAPVLGVDAAGRKFSAATPPEPAATGEKRPARGCQRETRHGDRANQPGAVTVLG